MTSGVRRAPPVHLVPSPPPVSAVRPRHRPALEQASPPGALRAPLDHLPKALGQLIERLQFWLLLQQPLQACPLLRIQGLGLTDEQPGFLFGREPSWHRARSLSLPWWGTSSGIGARLAGSSACQPALHRAAGTADRSRDGTDRQATSPQAAHLLIAGLLGRRAERWCDGLRGDDGHRWAALARVQCERSRWQAG